jgi:hypothetical protein
MAIEDRLDNPADVGLNEIPRWEGRRFPLIFCKRSPLAQQRNPHPVDPGNFFTRSVYKDPDL